MKKYTIKKKIFLSILFSQKELCLKALYKFMDKTVIQENIYAHAYFKFLIKSHWNQ